MEANRQLFPIGLRFDCCRVGITEAWRRVMGRRKAWPVQDSIASAARLAVGEEVFGIHKPGAINEVRDFVGALFEGRVER